MDILDIQSSRHEKQYNQSLSCREQNRRLNFYGWILLMQRDAAKLLVGKGGKN